MNANVLGTKVLMVLHHLYLYVVASIHILVAVHHHTLVETWVVVQHIFDLTIWQLVLSQNDPM